VAQFRLGERRGDTGAIAIYNPVSLQIALAVVAYTCSLTTMDYKGQVGQMGMARARKLVLGGAVAGILIALALSILIFGLLHRRAPQGAATQLVMGFRPTVVVDLALMMAIEGGEFERAGIHVTLKPYGRADLLLAALNSGELQGSAGIPLEPLLGMAGKGEYPFRAYLVWYFDPGVAYDGFVVLKDSPVQDFKGLSGKVVGSHPSKQVTDFVQHMLPNATVLQYNPATPLLSVKSGDQDAAYVLEPVISQAVVSGQYRLVEPCAISRHVFDKARIPAAVSLLSNQWIEEHPEAAATFVRIATAAQARRVRAPDPQPVIQLLARKEYGGFPADVAARVVEPACSTPGELNELSIMRFLTYLKDAKLLNGEVNSDRLFYREKAPK
jgi:ABC-type nitrate/sulfonate/bicarbonate transport system substrate-binding protein